MATGDRGGTYTTGLGRSARARDQRASFTIRRLLAMRDVAQRENAGALNPRAGFRELQHKGYVPGGIDPSKQPHGIARIFAQTVADLTTAGLNAPAGVGRMLENQAFDVRDFATGKHTGLTDSFPRTRALLRGVSRETYNDLRHPLRHPGYTLLDALSLASAAAAAPSAARRAAIRAGTARDYVRDYMQGNLPTRSTGEALRSATRAWGRSQRKALLDMHGLSSKTLADRKYMVAPTLYRRGSQEDRYATSPEYPLAVRAFLEGLVPGTARFAAQIRGPAPRQRPAAIATLLAERGQRGALR